MDDLTIYLQIIFWRCKKKVTGNQAIEVKIRFYLVGIILTIKSFRNVLILCLRCNREKFRGLSDGNGTVRILIFERFDENCCWRVKSIGFYFVQTSISSEYRVNDF